MPEILRKWLANTVGVIFDLEAENFGKSTRDGRLIGHIFLSYDIISEQQLELLITTSDPQLARANFKHIKMWMDTLNVQVEDGLYEQICRGNGSAAIKLLYQLYLALETRDRLYFLAKQKQPPQPGSYGK